MTAPDFPDGVALVVGAAGALGAASCRALARAGSDLALTWRSKEAPVLELAAELAGHDRPGQGRVLSSHRCDLADRTAPAALIAEVLAQRGAIHTLVFAAGADLGTPWFAETGTAEWEQAVTIDVHGFFHLAQAILPHFRARGGGAIVAVTTGATSRLPPRDVLSAAPKAAVETMVKAIAREEGRNGIRANAVAPGWIESGLGARMLQEAHAGDASRVVKAIPLRRLGRAEDIGEAVAYMASARASFITGQVLTVDGGANI